MAERKYNNKHLLGILVALVALYFLTDLLRGNRSSSRELPAQLITLDTAQLTAILVDPPQADPIRLQRQDGSWSLVEGGRSFAANEDAVQQLIRDLNGLEPERLVSRNTDSWDRYALTDSAATRVAFNYEANPAATLFIGRFNYQPPPQGMNPMGQNPQFTGTTYVRVGDAPAVYTTDGFLAMSVPGDRSAWRLNDFLRLTNKSAVRQILFDYPEEEFSLLRQPDQWSLGGIAADSMTVETYLNIFINRPNRQFADGFAATDPPTHVITLRGDNMTDLRVEAWPAGEDTFVLHSSLNPDAYFESPADGLFQQLFVDRQHFLGD